MAIEALEWPTSLPDFMTRFDRVVQQEVSQSFWDQRPVQINPLSGHWRAVVTFHDVDHNTGHFIDGVFAACNGREWPIKVPMRGYRKKLGTAGAGWAVNGSVAAGVRTLPLTGGSGAFAVGDFIVKEISGNPFLYRVTVAGGSSIGIWPEFQASATGGSIQYLGDGSSTVLYCSMDLVSDTAMTWEPGGGTEAYARSFSVEFEQSSPYRFL